MEDSLPKRSYSVPELNHKKVAMYIDFPLVYNAIVTNEAFYVDRDWTFVTSDLANTTLYKWNGGGWTTVAGVTSPDTFISRGYYSVTTAAAAYVAITEHVD
jgi:hypothetical protein